MRTVLACVVALAMAAPILAQAKKPPADDSAAIAEKLLQRIDLGDGLDTNLRDALSQLSKMTEVNFLVDRRAMQQQFGDFNVDMPVKIAPMRQVRVETVLREIADQIEGADFYIAPDHVKFTTSGVKDLVTGQAKPLPELYPPTAGDAPPEFDRREVVRQTPYITAAYKDVSAADAFKDVAARAGRSLVVSDAAAEKAKAMVNVGLSNVAFETAAGTLAEAAGLRAFRNGNVVVVVTAERAKQVATEKSAVGILGGCMGVNFGGGGAGMYSVQDLESIITILDKARAEKKKE